MACKGCNQLVEPGELRYTGRSPEEWHAHCWADRADYLPHTNTSDLRAALATSVGNVERAFDKLKKELTRHGRR